MASALPGADVRSSRPISKPGDARSCNADRNPASGRMATGRRDGASVRRRRVRRGRMPVRGHVLSRPAPGVFRGSPRAEAGRYLFIQRLGPDRRQRIRRVRAHAAAESVFPSDPPRFLLRTPRTVISTKDRIRGDLQRKAGSRNPSRHRDRYRAKPRGTRRALPALGFCHGSPLRSEIAARDPARLGDVVDAATETLARRFGSDAIDGKMQAHVVTVRK